MKELRRLFFVTTLALAGLLQVSAQTDSGLTLAREGKSKTVYIPKEKIINTFTVDSVYRRYRLAGTTASSIMLYKENAAQKVAVPINTVNAISKPRPAINTIAAILLVPAGAFLTFAAAYGGNDALTILFPTLCIGASIYLVLPRKYDTKRKWSIKPG